jgi:hypothetical protein
MTREDVKSIVKDYFYQKICKGDPKWPSGLDGSEKKEDVIEGVNSILSRFIHEPISLESLSLNPGAASPVLTYILEEYEEDWRNAKPFNVRRFSLPRLFTLFPVSSLHWRSVIVDPGCLAVFAKLKIEKGYYGKLKMFKKVFKLDKLKYNG